MTLLTPSTAGYVGEAAKLLRANSQRVSVAESCTGGLLAGALTSIAGSSGFFSQGLITYSNDAKTRLLAVDRELLERHGAVSAPACEAMVRGLLEHFEDDYAVAISGIAGPGGGTAEKPVGTVFIAWANRTTCRSDRFCLSGDREAIRAQAVELALQGLIEVIKNTA